MDTYPEWHYFPSSRPPDWVHDLVGVISASQSQIDSRQVDGLNSDSVLAVMRPGLEAMGFEVESGKKADQ